MEIVKPSVHYLWSTQMMLQRIELAARTCYKSEENITDDSAVNFVKMLVKRGHEAMLEHGSMTYRVICDRAIANEIVRHRLFSFAQESTRYVNYNKRHMQFIMPCFLKPKTKVFKFWKRAIEASETAYNVMIAKGATPQEARSVLPLSLKTEIIITGNLRQWRNFLKVRCDGTSHPQMRDVAKKILEHAHSHVPVVFADIYEELKNEI